MIRITATYVIETYDNNFLVDLNVILPSPENQD